MAAATNSTISPPDVVIAKNIEREFKNHKKVNLDSMDFRQL